MKSYDPYRSPLRNEPPQPLDYARDAVGETESDEHEPPEQEAFENGPERPIRDFAPEPPECTHRETSMWKSLFDLFISFLNGDPNNNRGRQVVMTLAVIALTGFTASALGWFPVFGFAGFAYASDVKEIRIDQLDEKIQNTVKDHCSADTQKAKSYYYEKLSKLNLKYLDIDPRFKPPSCRDLGVPDIQVTR